MPKNRVRARVRQAPSSSWPASSSSASSSSLGDAGAASPPLLSQSELAGACERLKARVLDWFYALPVEERVGVLCESDPMWMKLFLDMCAWHTREDGHVRFTLKGLTPWASMLEASERGKGAPSSSSSSSSSASLPSRGSFYSRKAGGKGEDGGPVTGAAAISAAMNSVSSGCWGAGPLVVASCA